MSTPDTTSKPPYKHLSILLKSLLYFAIILILFAPRTTNIRAGKSVSTLDTMKQLLSEQKEQYLAPSSGLAYNQKYTHFREVSLMNSEALEKKSKKIFIGYPHRKETAAPVVIGINIYNPDSGGNLTQIICRQEIPSPRPTHFRFVSYRHCPLDFQEEKIP
jgi:hypothetical protein